MEHTGTYTDNSLGVELELKVKAECLTEETAQQVLSFMAISSRRFYLEFAEKINSTL